ncbi:hypothetical protein O4H66_14690 [Comamonadaceae bacterium G21597-S1]|nr:hypothetical protein [Comamonadaceae bacterium G21597-S1]
MGKFSVEVNLLVSTCATLGSVAFAAEPALTAVYPPISADHLLDPALRSTSDGVPTLSSKADPQAASVRSSVDHTVLEAPARNSQWSSPTDSVSLVARTTQESRPPDPAHDSMESMPPGAGGTVIWQLILAATAVLTAFAYMFRAESSAPGKSFPMPARSARSASTDGSVPFQARPVRKMANDLASERNPFMSGRNRISRMDASSERDGAHHDPSSVSSRCDQGRVQDRKPWQ